MKNRRRSWAAVAALVLAVATGAALRLWNLRLQVVGDDEMHGVHAAPARSPREVCFRYEPPDHARPLTSLLALRLRAGAPVGAGPAAAVAARRAGTAGGDAWLLALSP